MSLSVFGQANCEDAKLNIALHRYIHTYPFFKEYEVFSDSGLDKFYAFIRNNLVYPETAKKDKIEGVVVVSFWIDSTATTSDHKISQGIREDLDTEALRIAKLIKFDLPAKDYYGKPTGMCFTLPIRFKLDDKKLKK